MDVTEKNVFMARHAILDRDGKTWGYELLFRDGHVGHALVKSNLAATARVIANTFQHFNINYVLGDKTGLVNIDHTIIYEEFIEMLPQSRFILEILETTEVDEELVKRVEYLKSKGFRFALDDFDFSKEMLLRFKPLFPLADLIKVDLFTLDQEMMEQVMPAMQNKGMVFLAEKVENQEVHEICLEYGFQYFQGFYFQKPQLLEDRAVEPSRLAVIELIELLRRDEQTHIIEAKFKEFPDLTINLLKYLNSAAVATREDISSVRSAITLAGKNALMRWLSVFLFAQANENPASETLLEDALLRGHVISRVLKHKGQAKEAEEGFITGVLSLMDALFGQTMEEMLEKVSISMRIKKALLERSGTLGDLLTLAELLETDQLEEATKQAKRLGLKVTNLQTLQTKFYSRDKSDVLGL